MSHREAHTAWTRTESLGKLDALQAECDARIAAERVLAGELKKQLTDLAGHLQQVESQRAQTVGGSERRAGCRGRAGARREAGSGVGARECATARTGPSHLTDWAGSPVSPSGRRHA